MLAESVRTQLETIEALTGRARTAADLSDLVAQKQLPQSPAAAFVVPGGLRPLRQPDTSAGAYTHEIDEVVAVVLFVRFAGDATGERGLVQLDPLILDVLTALCGWEPADGENLLLLGPGRLSRGQLVSINAGSLLYQLEFAFPLQLRILA